MSPPADEGDSLEPDAGAPPPPEIPTEPRRHARKSDYFFRTVLDESGRNPALGGDRQRLEAEPPPASDPADTLRDAADDDEEAFDDELLTDDGEPLPDEEGIPLPVEDPEAGEVPVRSEDEVAEAATLASRIAAASSSPVLRRAAPTVDGFPAT